MVVFVITGASAGIGEQLALQLSSLSVAQLVLLGRDEIRLAEVASRCQRSTPDVLPIRCDITSRAEVNSAIATALEKFGTIDVLINNAGQGLWTAPSELTDDIIDNMMKVNVYGVLYAIQAVLPAMKRSGTGQIINVSSVLGRVSNVAPNRSAYTASKHFLNGLTGCFREELRQTFPNIFLQTFTPGPVATNFGLKEGGPDQKLKPTAQDPADVARVLIKESIQEKKLEVYSSEAVRETVVKFYQATL